MLKMIKTASFLAISRVLKPVNISSKRGIVLCDIDDTVLHFGGITEKYFKETSREDDPLYIGLFELIEHETPLLVSDTFFNFYEEVHKRGYEFEFVTARNIIFGDITIKHLEHFGLDYHKIHHLADKCKGEYIKELQLTHDEIIFIDNDKTNCEAVEKHNENVVVVHFTAS
jgi:hypothetical protein